MPNPGYSKNSSSAMPHFPNRTVAVAVNHLSPDNDEDNDICPVCDGDCTCNNKPRPLPPSVGHGSARFVATPTTSSVSSAHALGAQPLKIKLTVPPSIQSKARSLGSVPQKTRFEESSPPSTGVASSSSVSFHLTSVSSIAGRGQPSSSDAVGQKRKGRLPKVVAITRDDREVRGNEVSTLPQSQSHLSSHTHSQRPVTSRATRPQVETSQSNIAASRQASKSQVRGTIAKRSASTKKKQGSVNDVTVSDLQPRVTTTHNGDGDDTSSGRFPTFVSADELTSEASDSSDSDSDSGTSGFGSDSSLAAEEESYIVAEQRRHDKARIRRELLGDDVPKLKDSNNSWLIRPRKKSVGFSDVDMEGDTDDATEEDEDEDEEMEDDEDEDEEDEPDGRASRVYTGLATGWSDDEESSFDADLFFANLTDASSDDGSSDSDDSHPCDSATDPLATSLTSLRSVDIEVTETWDGQVVFTNGSNEGHGVLDLAFEANAAQLLASDSASVSQDSDVEMHISDGAEGDFDIDDSELGESDGDTTEEELVDEQGLPTSRAMRLYQWPTSVSSINPLSTVSPNVSPFSRRHPSSTLMESPRPADILAGKLFWGETDRSQHDSMEGSAGESPRPLIGMPIMGQFSLEGDGPQKTAVLTGANKDVPSPYPRLSHRRSRFSSSVGSFSSMDLRGRTARLSICPPLLSPPFDGPPSEIPPDISLGEPIKLDDVLDATLLDSEPEVEVPAIPDSEGEQRLAQSLSRWDRVPVGAFRLTREPAPSASDVPTSPDWASEPAKPSASKVCSYGNALKNSPLRSMLWNEKSCAKEKPRRSRGVIISPVLLPVRDGDRTPTHIPYQHDLHSNHRQQQHTPFKNRKESRREMKMMKRKTHGPSHQHHDHHQRHHRRNHHPNMKSRGNASVQRTFYSSPTSAPALNI